jgi:hypothetical protein
MSPDKQRVQQYLKAFDFAPLFREELGWDTLKEAPVAIPADSEIYTLSPLVQKRGFKVYLCSPTAQGKLPASPAMRQIERELTKHAYEHLIIYAAREQQAWQWVKREPGKPSAFRLYRLHTGQSGELLSQKLLSLAFSIEEEDRLGTAIVAARVRQALDAERVTKKFYERFQNEHATFLTFIDGIALQSDCEWYASLMLNRLMFVYFIQKKGVLATSGHGQLDGDVDYLSHKLTETRQRSGEDQFYSFYRYFLLRLFHEGLSRRERSPELEQLLGNVPYLNGGLFDVHQLEQHYPDIQIADEAFERIFAFFDDYRWHLDERPLRNDREINPDVLGYIFEKYINQKQMGAYYTKEDITGYISKNTVIPCLLEATEQKCSIAFTPDGFVWSLLRRDPDRYIYEAVKHGCDLSLPPEIAAGIHDVSQHGEWNKPAPDAYALPTEIWREVVARRQRYEEMKAKLIGGAMISVNDLITFNLDLSRFAEDIIAYSEGIDLLSAFYASLETITILDPTCGSGAFLFAALNMLEPLYEGCLDRMQEMVAERDRLDALEPQHLAIHPGVAVTRFRDILGQVAKHPNRRYFILKSIIVNNLYGVDIMEEAIEICKLRLFLKLVAQIGRSADMEPLPDIDFNIRAGNTLVGFASLEEVSKAVSRDLRSAMTSTNTVVRIEQQAQEALRGFEDFRRLQVEFDPGHWDIVESKQHLHEKLALLRAELDCYLAAEYGIDRNNIVQEEEYNKRFEQWQQSHQPFHWFVEFYGIMKKGGFDVIIGNPPYVEYSEVKADYRLLPDNYRTINCGNLYAYCIERSIALLTQHGRWGMIVPLSGFSTVRMQPLQATVAAHSTSFHVSFLSGDANPAKLFEGVKFRLCIGLAKTGEDGFAYDSTKYVRWYAEARNTLFDVLNYYRSTQAVIKGSLPKLGRDIEFAILKKVRGQPPLRNFASPGNNALYYHNCPVNWIRATTYIPSFRSDRDGVKVSSQIRQMNFEHERLRDAAVCIINSTLFFWFWLIYSDCYHLTDREIGGFPINLNELTKQWSTPLSTLCSSLMKDYKAKSKERTYVYKTTGTVVYDEFYPKLSKPIIDEIDRVIAKHYGFTDEELDFIINYDIKYRMGRDSGENDEE